MGIILQSLGTILPKAVNNNTIIAIEKGLTFKIYIYFLVFTFPVQVLSKILWQSALKP